jgi:hypothetical protein
VDGIRNDFHVVSCLERFLVVNAVRSQFTSPMV